MFSLAVGAPFQQQGYGASQAPGQRRDAEQSITGAVVDDPQRTMAPDGSILVEADVEEAGDQTSTIHRVIFCGLAQSDFATYVHAGDTVTVTGHIESRETQRTPVFMASGFQLNGKQTIALEGRVGAFPESMDVQGRNGVVHLTKAVVAGAKRADGSTEWRRLALWNDAAKAFAARVQKNDTVRAIGSRIRVSEYTSKEGVPRTSFELTAKDFEVLGSGEGSGEAMEAVEGEVVEVGEVRATATGKTVLNASVATGALPDGRPAYRRVSLWNRTARAFAATVRPGARVRVEGIPKESTWVDREGQQRTSHDLMGVKFSLLDASPGAASAPAPARTPAGGGSWGGAGGGAGAGAGAALEAAEGELVEAAEVRELEGGKAVLNAALLLGRLPDGRPQLQRFSLWDGTARAFAAAARPGARVRVEGRFKTKNWVDREGQQRTSRELSATKFSLLDSLPGSGGPAPQPPAAPGGTWTRSAGFGRGAYDAAAAAPSSAAGSFGAAEDVAPF
eukprot:tig00001130_g7258.t1